MSLVQPPHRSCAAGEFIGFDAEALEHRDEEIGERVVVGLVEGEVLAVLVAAAGEEHGQVVGVMVIAVAEIAAVEDLRVVEQGSVAFLRGFEFGKQRSELAEFGEFEVFELVEFVFAPDVVGEVVALAADAGDVFAEAVEPNHECDEARAVRGKGEMREVHHRAEFFEQVFAIARRGRVHFRLGFALPFLSDEEAAFHFAHRGEILVHPLAVGAAELLLQRRGACGHGVENAAPHTEVLDLSLHRCGIARDEQGFKNLCRTILGGEHHAAGIERERLVSALRHDQRQRCHARLDADALGGKLIKRDAVAKRRAARMRRGGEERRLRRVTACYIGVRRAGENGELVAEIL